MLIHSTESPHTCSFEDQCRMMLQTGERTHVCQICQKQFRVPENLIQHLQINLSCVTFARRFILFANCLQRQVFSHTNQKLFSCHCCNKQLTQSRSLNRHLIHSGERPYQCENCKKNKSNKHMLIYTRDKSEFILKKI